MPYMYAPPTRSGIIGTFGVPATKGVLPRTLLAAPQLPVTPQVPVSTGVLLLYTNRPRPPAGPPASWGPLGLVGSLGKPCPPAPPAAFTVKEPASNTDAERMIVPPAPPPPAPPLPP